MQAHWSREDLPHLRDTVNMLLAADGAIDGADVVLDAVVEHLDKHCPKVDVAEAARNAALVRVRQAEDERDAALAKVRATEAQRDTQKTKARRARRARDKWQAACEAATANAQMWMDEAVTERHLADAHRESAEGWKARAESAEQERDHAKSGFAYGLMTRERDEWKARAEAVERERDALDDRLAKVDVELSEALVRAEKAEKQAAKMCRERDGWRAAAEHRGGLLNQPDPVEDKARELYEAARPVTTVTWGDLVAEAKEPYRRIARHVLGADDE